MIIANSTLQAYPDINLPTQQYPTLSAPLLVASYIARVPPSFKGRAVDAQHKQRSAYRYAAPTKCPISVAKNVCLPIAAQHWDCEAGACPMFGHATRPCYSTAPGSKTYPIEEGRPF